MLVIIMLFSLCSCNNNSYNLQQGATNVNSATIIEKTEAKEVNLGDTISLEFMEMTIDDFIVSDKFVAQIDPYNSVVIQAENSDKKVVYLTGQIKNLHTDMIGGAVGNIGCVFGTICFNEKYNYQVDIVLNNKENRSGTLQPLTTGEFYLFARVPTSIAEEFTSCSVNFAFNENLSAIDLATSKDFDYKTCKYQYTVKGITR